MSVLSAGIVIREKVAEALGSSVTDVYPTESASATLPYVAYRRTGLDQTAVKNGRPANATYVDVMIYAKNYGESVELAERVAEALDGWRGEANGIACRMCQMTEAYEDKDGDAYNQTLTFKILI